MNLLNNIGPLQARPGRSARRTNEDLIRLLKRESGQGESAGWCGRTSEARSLGRLIALDGSERPHPTAPGAGQEGRRPQCPAPD